MNEKKYKMAKIRRAIFVEEGEMNEESAKYKTFFAFFKVKFIKIEKINDFFFRKI